MRKPKLSKVSEWQEQDSNPGLSSSIILSPQTKTTHMSEEKINPPRKNKKLKMREIISKEIM